MDTTTTDPVPGTPLTTEEHTKAHGDKIKGYRQLSEAEIEKINEIKVMGCKLGDMIDSLKAMEETDKRWVEEANTDLQKGIMSAVRSVAKPSGF